MSEYEAERGTPLPLPGFTYQGKNAQGYHEWDHDRTGIRMVQLPGGVFNMGSQLS